MRARLGRVTDGATYLSASAAQLRLVRLLGRYAGKRLFNPFVYHSRTAQVAKLLF